MTHLKLTSLQEGQTNFTSYPEKASLHYIEVKTTDKGTSFILEVDIICLTLLRKALLNVTHLPEILGRGSCSNLDREL